MKKNTFRRILTMILACMTVLSLAACAAAPAAPKDKGITLTDQAGRQVQLEAPAQTVVSCYYITTYAAMALGVSDRIVGLEKKAESRPIYHMADPALLDKPNVGSLKEFNVEAAAALEPDLVIMPMKLKDHAQTLTDLGIAVLVVDPESQAGLEQMLQLIAKACGVEDRAEKLLTYYDGQLARMTKLTEGRERPSVYLAGNSSYLETAPAGMYQSDLIELSGGANAAAGLEGDYWTEVSYESILTMDPEVIVIPAGAAYTADDVKRDAALADLSAVKNGKVFAMPQKIEEWDSPIPSGILGAMWMTSVLHEEAYPFAQMQKDAADYYQTFYGFAIDQALITK